MDKLDDAGEIDVTASKNPQTIEVDNDVDKREREKSKRQKEKVGDNWSQSYPSEMDQPFNNSVEKCLCHYVASIRTMF